MRRLSGDEGGGEENGRGDREGGDVGSADVERGACRWDAEVAAGGDTCL
jgi:hypothetical protein